MFTADCAANGWDESEVFAALRVLNRDGPGAVAIRQHAKSGGTYVELVTALTVVCGATDADLRWRRAEGLRQVYGETSRNFGLRVMNVTREAAAGEGYPEHWVMRKICTIWMNGLRDPGLRDKINREYDHRCHSIHDLFNIAEQYIQKEHRFASGEITATKECYATMCAAMSMEKDADGLASSSTHEVCEYEYESEDWSDTACREYVLASYEVGYQNYGLSPHFEGNNFSDDIAALRDPSWSGNGRYPSRGRGTRGRGRSGRPRARGGRSDWNRSRYDGGDNFQQRDLGSVQCYRCKKYGH